MPDLKQDAEKFDAEVALARKRSMDALNREETWIEQHPRTVTAIGVALLMVIIFLLVKAYA